MAEEAHNAGAPPYASFATIKNLIERMEQEGVPSRVDRTYLVHLSGGTRNQVKAALRFLGLIDEDDKVTPKLTELAKHPDRRPALLAALLRERFPEIVELGDNATRGELDEALRTVYGLQGETLRKAATFFINAAAYAGLPLSPHFKPSGSTWGSGGSLRRTSRRRTARPAEPTDPDVPSAAAMRHRYFELLIAKAEAGEELSPEVLDRIERLLGLEGMESDGAALRGDGWRAGASSRVEDAEG